MKLKKQRSPMQYSIYHIPGYKVGVTCNPEDRIEKQQGYTKDEYEILAVVSDVNEADRLEKAYQMEYFGKADKDDYTRNFKKESMRDIVVTQQDGAATVTLTYDLVNFSSEAFDADKITIHTLEYGMLEFVTPDEKLLLIGAIKSSKFGNGSGYVYVKAIARDLEDLREKRMNVIGQNGNTGEHYENLRSADYVSEIDVFDALSVTGTPESGPCSKDRGIIPEFQQIRDWANARGIYKSGDPKTQFLKLQEEAGEVARAILKEDKLETIDGLGDTLVVLINLAALCGYNLEDCLAEAYDVISKRTGKMHNGTFVKDA